MSSSIKAKHSTPSSKPAKQLTTIDEYFNRYSIPEKKKIKTPSTPHRTIPTTPMKSPSKFPLIEPRSIPFDESVPKEYSKEMTELLSLIDTQYDGQWSIDQCLSAFKALPNHSLSQIINYLIDNYPKGGFDSPFTPPPLSPVKEIESISDKKKFFSNKGNIDDQAPNPLNKKNNKSIKSDDIYIEEEYQPIKKSKKKSQKYEDDEIYNIEEHQPIKKSKKKSHKDEDDDIYIEEEYQPIKKSKKKSHKDEDDDIYIEEEYQPIKKSKKKSHKDEDDDIYIEEEYQPIKKSKKKSQKYEDDEIYNIEEHQPIKKSKKKSHKDEDDIYESVKTTPSKRKNKEKIDEQINEGPKKKFKWNPNRQDDPPLLGQKELPIGAPNCLNGLNFVITGTLESLQREVAADLIKKYAGRVTSAVSGKTSYVIAGSAPGETKLKTAKEKKVQIIDEDGLFELIRKGNEVPDEKVSTPKTPKKKSILELSHIKTPQSSFTNNLYEKKPMRTDTDLWVNKYKPSNLDEVVGNKSNIIHLLEWLKNWDTTWKDTGDQKLTISALKGKAALLSGPPGIGKTTVSHLVANTLKYECIELNASDVRSKKSLQSHMSEVVSSYSLFGLATKQERKKTLLIMDEIDGMSSGDRGGVAQLISFIRSSKIPIICICNDKYARSLKSLTQYVLDLPFRRPTYFDIAKRLLTVAAQEKIQVNVQTLERLSQSVNGDIRQAIYLLQMWKIKNHALSFEDVKNSLLKNSEKDIDKSPFDVATHFFKPVLQSSHWIDDQLDNYFVDTGLLPLFMFEMYASGSISNNHSSLANLSAAADAISSGDMINTYIFKTQDYTLSQLHGIFSTVLPGYILLGSGPRPSFPSWFGKQSTTGKNIRLINELHSHMAGKAISDHSVLVLEYLPFLRKFLPKPLMNADDVDSAIDEVLRRMEYYGLTDEDWISILEDFSIFSKKDFITSKIDSKTKAAFTRAWNIRGHIRVAPSKKISSRNAPKAIKYDEEGREIVEEEEEEEESINDRTNKIEENELKRSGIKMKNTKEKKSRSSKQTKSSNRKSNDDFVVDDDEVISKVKKRETPKEKQKSTKEKQKSTKEKIKLVTPKSKDNSTISILSFWKK